jgi:uncharacterized protein YbaP (TraB family)
MALGRRTLLAGTAALAACAGNAALTNEIDAAAATELARRPDHYVNGEARAFTVARDGQLAAMLWGTWHVGYDDATVLPRPIRDRFAAASSLSVEVVLDRVAPPVRRAMATVAARALLRADPAAVARLDTDTRRGLDGVGLPSGSLERFSLIGLARLVNRQASPSPTGLLPAVGFVDLDLIGFARSVAIPVHGLEDADPLLLERLLYADPNGADAAAMLRLALRRRPGLPGLHPWLRRRYRAGEIGAMAAGLAAWRADADDLMRNDRARGPLLSERNAAWMPRLEATIAEPGVAFVAFGAAHLTGTDGIVALLRRRGWNVAGCPGDRCGI